MVFQGIQHIDVRRDVTGSEGGIADLELELVDEGGHVAGADDDAVDEQVSGVAALLEPQLVVAGQVVDGGELHAAGAGGAGAEDLAVRGLAVGAGVEMRVRVWVRVEVDRGDGARQLDLLKGRGAGGAQPAVLAGAADGPDD